MMYKGRIVNIEKNIHSITFGVTGVKKEDQWKYRNNPGGYGTYVTGGENYPPTVDFKVFIYDLEKTIEFDLYEEILKQNNLVRLSPQLLEYVIEHNKGKKVRLYKDDNNEWHIHLEDLELMRNTK